MVKYRRLAILLLTLVSIAPVAADRGSGSGTILLDGQKHHIDYARATYEPETYKLRCELYTTEENHSPVVYVTSEYPDKKFYQVARLEIDTHRDGEKLRPTGPIQWMLLKGDKFKKYERLRDDLKSFQANLKTGSLMLKVQGESFIGPVWNLAASAPLKPGP